MNIGIAICALNPKGGRVQILPAGQFRASDGRPEGVAAWEVKNPNTLLARLQSRKSDLLFDYEHRSLKAASDGEQNPASGWVKPSDLEWTADGLFAKAVAWTSKAKSYIDAGEYRYLSPVFAFDAVTGEILDLLHVALTNDPAIDGMQGIIAAASRRINYDGKTTMDPELLKALGLAPDASKDAVLKAIADLKASVTDQTEQAACAKKNHELLLQSITEINQGVLKNQEQTAALLKQQTDSERQILIAANAKKLPASLKVWAEGVEIAVLKKYLESAPNIVPDLQTENTPPKDDTKAEITHEEIAMCSRLGLTKEEYLKVKTNART